MEERYEHLLASMYDEERYNEYGDSDSGQDDTEKGETDDEEDEEEEPQDEPDDEEEPQESADDYS